MARRHGALPVNLYKLSGEMMGSHPEFPSMNCNPTEQGYARRAEAMWAVLEQAVRVWPRC
ncbi:MAG: hypothetical protein WCD76_08525 [Pyrinomonadaceae bacterium]